MANHTNNEELRRQALAALAEGRVEVSAEMHRLQQQLSPARAIHRLVDRRPSLVMLAAFTTGILPALLIPRGKRRSEKARTRAFAPASAPPPKPVMNALVMGALGIFAKTLTPALIKSSIVPHVVDFLSRKGAAGVGNQAGGTGGNSDFKR